jgi:hypothetical protein
MERSSVKQIDFVKIGKTIIQYKKFYYYSISITFVLSCLIIFSVPRYYICTVKLAPELSNSSLSSIGNLASSFGIDMGDNSKYSDAISPELYPDLISSVDFKTSLFNIKVKSQDGLINETYYEYLLRNQKVPWWDKVRGVILSPFNKKENVSVNHRLNSFKLTKSEDAIAGAIENNVSCSVDKKNFVISITVTDQDPLICATMADSVKTRLQTFITDYRTSKAKNDLEFTKKLYTEAKERYVKLRQQYGQFSDANTDLVLESFKAKKEDIENEMQLQFNNYSTICNQLQAAKAKVIERTPAFTTLQSATVPLKPAGPKRLIFIFCALVVVFVCTTLYVTLFKMQNNTNA